MVDKSLFSSWERIAVIVRLDNKLFDLNLSYGLKGHKIHNNLFNYANKHEK